MHNAQTLAMAVVGLAIVSGVKSWWWSFLRFLAGKIVIVQQEPIQEWEYCSRGDHMVRHTEMAWDGDDYVCGACAPVMGVH